MDLQTSKNLGGIGAILLFLGPLLSLAHFAGGLLSLIGFILVLIALNGFANYYKESGIFSNALYGFITGVVGVVVSIGAFLATALSALADLGIEDWANVAEWTEAFTAEAFTLIMDLIVAAIIAVVILFVFAIITAWFYRRSLSLLASKSGVGLFGTAGLLLLIGAVLTIIVIGVFLVWIAVLIAAIAFFQIRRTEAESTPQPT